LLEKQPPPRAAWYWYAAFLIESCPDRVEEGRKALEEAESLLPAKGVPPDARKRYEELREKLRAAEELRTPDTATTPGAKGERVPPGK